MRYICIVLCEHRRTGGDVNHAGSKNGTKFLITAIVLWFSHSHPAPLKGRFMSVARRGAGCGGRSALQDVEALSEAQAAAIRLTGRGSPAEDNKLATPPGCLSSGVVAEQAFKHRARNAGIYRRSVVTLLVRFRSNRA